MIKFIGNENERVQIKFLDFKLNGFPNELAGVSTGYLSLYAKLRFKIMSILRFDVTALKSFLPSK